jgi:predicted transcriptional regulator of viral defense system
MIALTGSLPCFDLALLVQAFDDPRAVIRVQLSRWMTQGSVIGLRRGLYTLADTYRRVPLRPAWLAKQLYRPSYLSGLWALAHYDLIPERVVSLASVTPRGPCLVENAIGRFEYRNLGRSRFFGYQTSTFGGDEIIVAEPEKALLDHWHLTPGEWTRARLEAMRYQHLDQIDADRLTAYANRCRSPRLQRAVKRWRALAADEDAGTEVL